MNCREATKCAGPDRKAISAIQGPLKAVRKKPSSHKIMFWRGSDTPSRLVHVLCHFFCDFTHAKRKPTYLPYTTYSIIDQGLNCRCFCRFSRLCTLLSQLRYQRPAHKNKGTPEARLLPLTPWAPWVLVSDYARSPIWSEAPKLRNSETPKFR